MNTDKTTFADLFFAYAKAAKVECTTTGLPYPANTPQLRFACKSSAEQPVRRHDIVKKAIFLDAGIKLSVIDEHSLDRSVAREF